MSMKEKRRHSSIAVPYTYYKSVIPDFFSNVLPHWHEEFEINFIISGKCVFKCGEEEIIAKSGDIIFTAPGILHSITQLEKCKCFYDTLVFNSDMLGVNSSDRCTKEVINPIICGEKIIKMPVDKNNPYYDEMRISAENIFSCAKGNSSYLDLLIKSELMRLLWLMESGGLITETKVKKYDEAIKSVLEYISKNYSENITIEQLAKEVHMSKSHFMSSFKQYVGMGAIEYVNRTRVRAVCIMIAKEKMSASEAAFECGFRNLSNFNRLFRKYVGSSPTEYLKEAGAKS